MSYDSVLSEATRLTTIFKDQPWAKDDFWKMAPEIVAELVAAADLKERFERIVREVESLEDENSMLEDEVSSLRSQLDEAWAELSVREAAEKDLRNDLVACEQALRDCRKWKDSIV